jgi:hypothetical protein
MSEVITYAKVGGPPDDWASLQVVDLDTGEPVERVVEVNASEGWLIRHKVDDTGHIETANGYIVWERLDGRFEIRRP